MEEEDDVDGDIFLYHRMIRITTSFPTEIVGNTRQMVTCNIQTIQWRKRNSLFIT